MGKIKVSMTIDDAVFSAFKSYCQDNGMKVSPKVEQLMKTCIKDSTLQQFMK